MGSGEGNNGLSWVLFGRRFLARSPSFDGRQPGHFILFDAHGWEGPPCVVHSAVFYQIYPRSFQDSNGDGIGDIPGVGVQVGRLLTHPDRGEMDLIFNFDHLETPGYVRWDDYRYDLNFLKHFLIRYQRQLGPREWMSLFLENHDNPRCVSKVNPNPQVRAPLAKALAVIELGTRGVPFIYQGQEIAAINQTFPDRSALHDIESLNYLDEHPLDGWANVLAGSRDDARTPMRWRPGKNLGFTAATPWIDSWEASQGFTVAEQASAPDSVLHWYRTLIRARQAWALLPIAFWQVDRPDYLAWLTRFLPRFPLTGTFRCGRVGSRVRPGRFKPFGWVWAAVLF